MNNVPFAYMYENSFFVLSRLHIVFYTFYFIYTSEAEMWRLTSSPLMLWQLFRNIVTDADAAPCWLDTK